MKQLQMENENLRSTVKSLKQHMLKLMKDQKLMRTTIETLETELLIASKINKQLQEGGVAVPIASSPEVRRAATPKLNASNPAIPQVPQVNTNWVSSTVGGTFTNAGSAPITTFERVFSPGKRPMSTTPVKPLPSPPAIPKGVIKSTSNTKLNDIAGNGSKNSKASSPRGEDEYPFSYFWFLLLWFLFSFSFSFFLFFFLLLIYFDLF
jgi:hypothetical protein